MAINNMLIEIKNLEKEYVNDGVVTSVLHGLTFQIEHGEFISIMGPSGSGKSTLMHILGFLDRPSRGQYFFDTKEVSSFTDLELANLRNKKVGFVFQSFHLLAKTTVLDNVKLPLLYNSSLKNDKDRTALAREALISVGLAHRLDHFSNQLSGGEKQRVAIARALVNNPDVIFADEPTGNLDSKSGGQVMEIIEKLNEKGHTIILVTHESDTARHAKRIIRLRDGLIISDDVVSERRSFKEGSLKK